MTLILHERVGLDGRRPSPFSWRIRYALAHKGVAVEYRPTRFADVDAIERLSGQRMVPVLVDGTPPLKRGAFVTVPELAPLADRQALPLDHKEDGHLEAILALLERHGFRRAAQQPHETLRVTLRSTVPTRGRAP